MKIRRLVVKDFAAIRESDIEFGPGLNVLYGPNDLGKSTLADAIRLALLLPHTSSDIEDYVPWAGGQNPEVELTFETEAQRIWRVKKEFRKGGASVLEESKNGVTSTRSSALERWTADCVTFSAGASLNREAAAEQRPSDELPLDGSAIYTVGRHRRLSDSLQGDSTGTGKDRIAAALQGRVTGSAVRSVAESHSGATR
jgi:energy-coupling factor transporter ATP-binding protein EcfA2